jgi:hypothetical protein
MAPEWADPMLLQPQPMAQKNHIVCLLVHDLRICFVTSTVTKLDFVSFTPTNAGVSIAVVPGLLAVHAANARNASFSNHILSNEMRQQKVC